jgi:hypothetical protein
MFLPTSRTSHCLHTKNTNGIDFRVVFALVIVNILTTNVFGFVQLSTLQFTHLNIQILSQNHIKNYATVCTSQFSRRIPALGAESSSINGESSQQAAVPVPTVRGQQQSSSNIVNNNQERVTIGTAVMPVVASKQLVKKKLQTFSRYLEVECWKRSDIRGLEPVLLGVANACKQITRIVQRAQTDDVYGVALDVHGNPLSDTNVQGEVQQKLDVLCNTIMLQAFCGSGRDIHAVASEEEDEPRCCSNVMVSMRCTCTSFHLMDDTIAFSCFFSSLFVLSTI